VILYFRVLVIDDEEEVIKRLPGRVSVEQRKFEGRTYQIDLRLVRVQVERVNDETLRISNSTLEELSAACAQPPHIIIADYAYVQRETIEKLLQISQQGKEITEQDLIGALLSTSDLARAAQVFASDKSVDSYKRHNLRKNFLESRVKFYLYSYTSKQFIKAAGELADRARRTKAAFLNCNVIPIDTRYEFYNGSEFDWPNPTKHDIKFYSHLASGLVNDLVQREFLEYILSDTKRLKYVRIQRSVLSVGLIVALGGAIGAGSEWLGNRIVGLASTGLYIPALLIAGLSVLFILIMGLIVPFAFERIMSGLLSKSESEDKA